MRSKEFSPIHFPEAREIQSECGLAAFYLTEKGIRDGINLRSIAYQAGLDLQHRAQGSAGMMVTDGEISDVIKDLGWVSVVFKQGFHVPNVDNPKIAMLHMRYPTAGSSNHRANIQPFNLDGVWFGHHGNLTNMDEIKERVGVIQTDGDFPDSDSWIALNAIAKEEGETWGEKLINAQRDFDGGWAFILSDGKKIVASRDPYGIRPLVLGYLGSKDDPQGYILSVESSIFKNIPQTRSFREIQPGETIQIDESGETILEKAPKGRRHCAFEYVYMSWVNSVFGEKLVQETREKAGRLLWKEAPVEIKDDEQLIVVPVPDAGRPAAEGFVEEAEKDLGYGRVRLKEALVKNKYVGRNYIEPTSNRDVDKKFQVIEHLVRGKIVALIDDSIVRGDTMPKLVAKLLRAGVKEVHVRIVSPEIVDPCHFGIDMSGSLVALRIPDIEERVRIFGAKSLRHLSREGLEEAIGIGKDNLCMHCFGGDGPPLPKSIIPLKEA